jgi:lysophospholipid acyltransferase (LPLAT)-like uncharacterized protein
MKEAGKTAARPARRSGVVVPERARWHARLAARLIHALVLVLAASLRWRVRDHAALGPPGTARRAIFVIWHNRLALSLVIHRRFVRRGDHTRRLAALVSASRDGGLLARVLELFGVLGIRGSSSRRGAQALLELAAAARAGHDLAVTPDGPRGPRYEPQPGVVALARITGLPIVPVTYRLGWKYDLRSWDAFQIPLPFGVCEVEFGEELVVPADSDEAAREALRLELRRRMMALTRD